MPTVGTGLHKREYAYTPKGRQAARKQSRKTGAPVVNKRVVTTARKPMLPKKR